jgi:hypothetical protein
MAHSSPEGIELGKGSRLESLSLTINKEKVLEIKQQERMYSEEEVYKLLDILLKNNMCSVAGDELIEQFKKK